MSTHWRHLHWTAQFGEANSPLVPVQQKRDASPRQRGNELCPIGSSYQHFSRSTHPHVPNMWASLPGRDWLHQPPSDPPPQFHNLNTKSWSSSITKNEHHHSITFHHAKYVSQINPNSPKSSNFNTILHTP